MKCGNFLHWLAQVDDWEPGDKEKIKIFFKIVLGSDTCSSFGMFGGTLLSALL